MTESDVARTYAMSIYWQSHISSLCPNMKLPHWWEVDLAAVLKSKYWTEYEIKTSLADYRNDFKKGNRWGVKHDLLQNPKQIIKMGYKDWEYRYTCPNYFYFITTFEVEVPAYCGHIIVQEKEYGDNSIWEAKYIKKAPILHRNKLTDKQIQYISEKMNVRYWERVIEHNNFNK